MVALRWWLGCWVFCVVATQARAYDNFCVERSRSTSVRSKCSSRALLPADKSRNVFAHGLQCTGSHDFSQRGPQEFDFDRWADLLELPDGPSKAFAIRRQQPDIRWQGEIHYQTVETWSWQDCELLRDMRCGFQYHCRYQDGTVRLLVREDVRAVACQREMKRCYLDVTYHEQLYCSDETMTYDARFDRPSADRWNPSHPQYDDSIPNKYDLLVGETENIEVHNTVPGHFQKLASHLTPEVRISGARNDYRMGITFDHGGSRAVCRENSSYHFSATIWTLQRRQTKNPGTLKRVKTWDGEDVEPLLWKGDYNAKGEYVERALPDKLVVHDASAGQTEVMANQSLKSARDADRSGQDARKPFLKNTKVRIRLVEKRWWWWDKLINALYVNAAEGVKPSLNSFSKEQAVRISDSWEIELDSPVIDKNLFMKKPSWPFSWLYGSKRFRQHLRPGRHYSLRISIYQPGVRFYTQSCEDDPQQWRCRWWAIGPLGRKESHYYSDEMAIDFHASRNYDMRSGWQKFKDAIKIHDNFLHWVHKS